MLYLLSKLIPVPMRSTYRLVGGLYDDRSERATWWQWRDRIFRYRIQHLGI